MSTLPRLPLHADATALADLLRAKSDELAGAAARFAGFTRRAEPVDIPASPDNATTEGDPQ